MHRYDFAQFWPNLRESDFDFIGEKEGKGYNINIPLNKVSLTISLQRLLLLIKLIFKPGFGNSEYSEAFFNLLYPIAYEVTY